ncbi:MAG: hypothetical protein ACYC27_19105 [Armatimonadota bacterium]
MDIRSELEHANVITMDRDNLTDDIIKELSEEHSVLLICDIGLAEDADKRNQYVDALATANIISEDHVEGVMADESILIIVPLFTLEIAERLYRQIPHASHFVSIRLDGEVYSTAC